LVVIGGYRKKLGFCLCSVRFSAIDHQESVWGRRVTERDRLEKED